MAKALLPDYLQEPRCPARLLVCDLVAACTNDEIESGRSIPCPAEASVALMPKVVRASEHARRVILEGEKYSSNYPWERRNEGLSR